MASGIVHDQWTIRTLPLAVFLGVAGANAGCPESLFFVPLGHLAGLVLNPDLDLRAITQGERNAMRFRALAAPFMIMSWLYAVIFGSGKWPCTHRGLSHWPFIGTATRWLWFGGPFWMLAFVADAQAAVHHANMLAPALACAYLGNCLSDIVHLLVDATTKAGRGR